MIKSLGTFVLLFLLGTMSCKKNKLNTVTEIMESNQIAANDLRPVIILDAGHGGLDPGATHYLYKIFEKNITRQIVDATIELIDTTKYKVIETRPQDNNIHRRNRIAIAEKARAHILISIHVNAVNDTVTNGFEILYSDSTLYKFDTLTSDTISIASPYKYESASFAEILSKETSKRVPLKKRKIICSKPNLGIIWAGHFPSILFEVGFINSTTDLKVINTPHGQSKLAQAIVHSISLFCPVE